jgi:hypothetical protein
VSTGFICKHGPQEVQLSEVYNSSVLLASPRASCCCVNCKALGSDYVPTVFIFYRVSVSSNGRYIAAADGAGQVLLYGFLPYKGTFLKWDLVGNFRAHHSE